MFPPRPRRTAAIGLATVAAALTAGVLVAAGAATAAPAASTNASTTATNAHPYRRGLVPFRVNGASPAARARVSNLSYGGAIDGIGVTTGAEKVYVVFWGSQWGTQSTNGSGYATFSGDPKGMAARLQAMYKGLGTNGELWSGVMTQYCQGVSTGATSCPSTAAHVAYPTGGATLAGVWADESGSAPSQASPLQLGNEAVKAAGHFGNTSSTANRNAQYIVVSPTGTHPDGFNTPSGQFCAWHDWNGDSYVGAASSYGDIAFTNAPYVTDAGASCGQSYVNSGSAGALDGVTIVMGHEYAETITDQNPAGGWTDSSGNENADKCAWVGVGGTGGAQNVAFSTGSFAMQGTWSNLNSSCQISHAIVT